MVALPPNYIYRVPTQERQSILVKLAIKLSRGKITNTQEALFALFIVTIVLTVLALGILWRTFLTTNYPASDPDHIEGREQEF